MNLEGPSSQLSYFEPEPENASAPKDKMRNSSKPMIRVTSSVNSEVTPIAQVDAGSHKETAQRLLNKLFNGVAMHIRTRIDRRKFSKVYYVRRKSFCLEQDQAGDKSMQVEDAKVYAADDAIVTFNLNSISPATKTQQNRALRFAGDRI